MGHANIQTTMIYIHHQPKAAAADKLSQLVAQAVALRDHEDHGMSTTGAVGPA
jgi:hypothetical protein